MGKTIHQFVAEPFTNEIGQTVNPGDRVAYVTKGYRVHTGKGWFAGVFKDKIGNVVLTRVQGIRSEKPVKTGKMISYQSTRYNYETRKNEPYTYEYPETVMVSCEPHGTTVLQCHRLFKIEE